MAELLTNSYETIFIIDATLEEEQIANLKQRFISLIERHGVVDSVDDWGKRRLAYPINYKTEGYYVLVDFTAESEFPKELDRRYRITDGILRSIIIRKDDN